MSAEKYFIENINLQPRGLGGAPQDAQAWNLNYGLLEMAKQLAQATSLLEDQQRQIRRLQDAVQQLSLR